MSHCVSSHGERGQGALWDLLYMSTNPMHQDLIFFHAQLLIPSSSGVKMSTCEFGGGHKLSAHSIWHVITPHELGSYVSSPYPSVKLIGRWEDGDNPDGSMGNIAPGSPERTDPVSSEWTWVIHCGRDIVQVLKGPLLCLPFHPLQNLVLYLSWMKTQLIRIKQFLAWWI